MYSSVRFIVQVFEGTVWSCMALSEINSEGNCMFDTFLSSVLF